MTEGCVAIWGYGLCRLPTPEADKLLSRVRTHQPAHFNQGWAHEAPTKRSITRRRWDPIGRRKGRSSTPSTNTFSCPSPALTGKVPFSLSPDDTTTHHMRLWASRVVRVVRVRVPCSDREQEGGAVQALRRLSGHLVLAQNLPREAPRGVRPRPRPLPAVRHPPHISNDSLSTTALTCACCVRACVRR